MNPILQATLDHAEAGKEIIRVTVDNRICPSKVIFEFVCSTEDLRVEVDRETFMNWWKQTGGFIRRISLISPLDELE